MLDSGGRLASATAHEAEPFLGQLCERHAEPRQPLRVVIKAKSGPVLKGLCERIVVVDTQKVVLFAQPSNPLDGARAPIPLRARVVCERRIHLV